MPDVILLTIFDAAIQDHRSTYEGMKDIFHRDRAKIPLVRAGPEVALSQVNQRFRELTLKTSKMWSHISNTLSCYWMDLRLDRSLDQNLTIELTLYGEADVRSAEQLITRISSHMHRLQHFRCIATARNYRAVRRVKNELCGSTVQSLESIKFFIDGYRGNKGRRYQARGVIDFGGNWDLKMDNLKQISVSSPRFLSSITNWSVVTNVHLALTCKLDDLRISDLEAMLEKLINVIDLKLELPRMHEAGSYAERPEIMLPTLKKLFIFSESPCVMRYVMEKLQMPTLKDLRVSGFVGIYDGTPEDWMAAITDVKCESVESFSMKLERNRNTCGFELARHINIASVSLAFPSLANFEFESNYAKPSFHLYHKYLFPHLKVLRFAFTPKWERHDFAQFQLMKIGLSKREGGLSDFLLDVSVADYQTEPTFLRNIFPEKNLRLRQCKSV